MSKQIRILLLLLLAFSTTLIHARPNDELAARLSHLYMDPANDVRYNDIDRFDDGEVKYIKRKLNKEAILRMMSMPTDKPDASVDSTESAEVEEGLMRSMVSSIFSFMSNMMRRLILR